MIIPNQPLADTAVDDAWHRILEAGTVADIDAATADWRALVLAEQAEHESQVVAENEG